MDSLLLHSPRASHTGHVAPHGRSLLRRSPAQIGQHGCPAPKAVSPVLCEAPEPGPVWQLQMTTWKLSSLPAHLPLDCSPTLNPADEEVKQMQWHAPRVQEKQPGPCKKQLRQKLGGQVPGRAPGVITVSLPVSPYEMKRHSQAGLLA